MSTNLRAADASDELPDGADRRVAIVCARFNDAIVERLERGARAALAACGVADGAIVTVWVPGALEVPQVAAAAARSGRFDAVVGLGAIIRGDTYHFEVVADTSARGLQQVALDTGVAVTNGVLTVDDVDQAEARSVDGIDGNKGAEAAIAALVTADALEVLSRPAAGADSPR